MIEHLTAEQQARVEAIRAETFAAVTSCVTDRAAAEAAARVVVAPALTEYEVHWVSSPRDADSLGASLRDSLGESLWASLRASLWASLGASLRASLWASLWESLWASLRASLWASLRDSLRDSLWDSLRDSLWASLWDSPSLAYYVAAAEVAGLKDERVDRMLAALRLVQSCTGIWVVPGHVILCEAPTRREVVDGRLVSIEWGGAR